MSSFATLPTRLAAQWSSSSSTTADPAAAHLSVNVAASGVTDPGGAKCRVNQDTFFTHCDPNSSAMVLGVFDGHGKEAGRDAALAAKDFFKAHFQSMTRSDYEALEQNPQRVFSSMFSSCHDAIKSVLKAVYERRGFTVQEKDGYVVKSQAIDQEHSCVRGGTTASIVVILDGGRKIWTANVGDSSVVLGAKHDGVRIKRSDLLELQEEEDAESNGLEATSTDLKSKSSAAASVKNLPSSTRIVMLTGDHSPDNQREFLRARAFRASDSDRNEPELRFLFDSSDPRAKRKSIFRVDSESGELTQSEKGDYLKNVRDEWATLVATPLESPFPDSLAFTRSLGDFHMHAYGVSCEPSVCELSLERIAQRALFGGRHSNQDHEDEDDAMTSDDNNSEPGSSGFGCHLDEDEKHSALEFMLVAASDGVWDNWKFDELFQFLNASDEKRARRRSSSGGSSSSSSAKRDSVAADTAADGYAVDNAVAALLKANLKRAQSIFGDDSDNMTAVLCHFRVSS